MQKHYNSKKEKIQADERQGPMDYSEFKTISIYEFSFRTYDVYRDWILTFLSEDQYMNSTEDFKIASWELFAQLEKESLIKKIK